MWCGRGKIWKNIGKVAWDEETVGKVKCGKREGKVGGGRESYNCSVEDKSERRKYNRKDSRFEAGVKEEEENTVRRKRKEGGRKRRVKEVGRMKWEGRTTKQATHHYQYTLVYQYISLFFFVSNVCYIIYTNSFPVKH